MFKIEKEEKVLKNIRFPKSLIERIEKETKQNNISFTKFVIEACLYALNNIDEKET